MICSLGRRSNNFFSLKRRRRIRSDFFFFGGGGLSSVRRICSASTYCYPPPDTRTEIEEEKFKEEFEIGSHFVKLETGPKVSPLPHGAVVLTSQDTIPRKFSQDDTILLRKFRRGEHVCKVSSIVDAQNAVVDSLLLNVDYHRKQQLDRKVMFGSWFMRNQGCVSRTIERPIRPLFPDNLNNDVQVLARVVCDDEQQDTDIMAANATSAALMLSDIPWGGPIGMVRVGRVDGEFIINPTINELERSVLNLVYACTRDKTLVVDAQAYEISERDLEAALRLAHKEAVKYLDPQLRLVKKAGRRKRDYKLSMLAEKTVKKIESLAESPINAILDDPKFRMFECEDACDVITQDLKRALEEDLNEESLKVLPKMVDTLTKKVLHKRIIKKGLRIDGRCFDELRPLFCESGNLPISHGSSLFGWGATQVLCTVTQSRPGDEVARYVGSTVLSEVPIYEYKTPPFSVDGDGEKGDLDGCGVRNGKLVEEAMVVLLPSEKSFPYTVRINQKVLNSDGSTCMATLCGGSIALMDAGVPLQKHVAGVSVGLVSEIDPASGKFKDYRILTDLSGLEEHLGNMDFKVMGTREGLTAVHLDIKLAGVPLDIICESLGPALKGRLQILDHMEQVINAPRFSILDDWNWDWPIIDTYKPSASLIQRLLEPDGDLKREIKQETGAIISLEPAGTVCVVGKNETSLREAYKKVAAIED
ncbi:hypothetical protein MKW94_014439 [Papaver nudicaule]|uniref:Uncharacterized protein n=1 Tax=Papaver nudicaule TaxID=74823 RepID=A0AA41RW64_PAPNU|nr:hypothetical protein [Papaver nudicaule]